MKHIPKKHKYHKIFNRNTVKISYSCMPNIKNIITSHNKKILNESEVVERKCNCLKKEECPLENQCLSTNIVYEATLSDNASNATPATYIGISETTFKLRYANHKKAFNHARYEADTELSKAVWKMKNKNMIPNITWKIRKKCAPYNQSTGKCNLCLSEKLEIIEENENKNLLNKRDELVSR